MKYNFSNGLVKIPSVGIKTEFKYSGAAIDPPAIAAKSEGIEINALGGGLNHSVFNGDKFVGGFGPTSLFSMDYWTLRKNQM